MRLVQYAVLVTGILLILSAGCDNNTEVGSKEENSAGQQPTPQRQERTIVSPAVEGGNPAIADREKDMTLVARETQQQEAEREAIRKDMERGMGQPESERTAPQ